jgi:hypothetical protein
MWGVERDVHVQWNYIWQSTVEWRNLSYRECTWVQYCGQGVHMKWSSTCTSWPDRSACNAHGESSRGWVLPDSLISSSLISIPPFAKKLDGAVQSHLPHQDKDHRPLASFALAPSPSYSSGIIFHWVGRCYLFSWENMCGLVDRYLKVTHFGHSGTYSLLILHARW